MGGALGEGGRRTERGREGGREGRPGPDSSRRGRGPLGSERGAEANSCPPPSPRRPANASAGSCAGVCVSARARAYVRVCMCVCVWVRACAYVCPPAPRRPAIGSSGSYAPHSEEKALGLVGTEDVLLCMEQEEDARPLRDPSARLRRTVKDWLVHAAVLGSCVQGCSLIEPCSRVQPSHAPAYSWPRLPRRVLPHSAKACRSMLLVHAPALCWSMLPRA